MNLFYRPIYRSDTTQFIQQLREANPDLKQQQIDGRALLWDKPVDRAAWKGFRAGQVQQQPYVYQSKS